MKVYNIAVFTGGLSTEHQISLVSASSIQSVLKSSEYTLHIIGIDDKGQWWYYPDGNFTNGHTDVESIALSKQNRFQTYIVNSDNKAKLVYADGEVLLDVALPILHGFGGEDGRIQGFFDIVGLKYVGCGVMASAIAIDKQITKDVLRGANIPVADGIAISKGSVIPSFDELSLKFDLPLYIKPACQGSSVGVSCVTNQKELDAALNIAFDLDYKVLIEGCVQGREIECAILGNENPKASPLGEVQTNGGFYDFNSKYVDNNASKLIIPANLTNEVKLKIQQYALKAFKAIGGCGLARIDFLLREDGSFVINEINTMPGFTPISMYPKLWQEANLSYTDLVKTLIELA